MPLFGRPLTLSGEYDLALAVLSSDFLGDFTEDAEPFILEQQLELEAFYSFGPALSLFAQVRLGMDVFPDGTELYAERGEMWLYSENVGGTPFDVDLGRLNFEDDRRWWWDEELDALRVAYEGGPLALSLAAAYELGPSRTDRRLVDPDLEGVLRLIAALSWEWRENHAVELFGLLQNDSSPTPRPGQRLAPGREDPSDARLGWLGGRLVGGLDFGRRGAVGYWLDTGVVLGREQLVEFSEVVGGQIEAASVRNRSIRGFGFDAGLNWLMALPFEPRLYGGYAFGSGDADPESSTDRAYRQSGLETNEAGVGAVERFPTYGALLDPELSNLGIVTLGAGVALWRASSLDLAYHYYHFAEPAPSLRDSRLDAPLNGRSRDIGHELDVVLGMQEWARVEVDLVASALYKGGAFDVEDGSAWAFGGFVELRLNF